MTYDQLRGRLAGLPLGGMVCLARDQFEKVFTQADNHEGNCQSAIELAEGNGCRLMFREGSDPYAVFTRRQHRSEVVTSERTRVAP